MTGPARRLALLLVMLSPSSVAGAAPATWTVLADKSRILVHVYKRGLFSGLAHDHHFSPTDWHATAALDPGTSGVARVEVVVAARSLRDQQEGISERDREKVNQRAAGPEALDAARFPEIRFIADRGSLVAPGPAHPESCLDGELLGTLSLHGREHPITVAVHATRDGEGWRIRGSTRFKQSDFGIEPFSGFAGTVGVRDEVVVEYELVMGPQRAASSPAR